MSKGKVLKLIKLCKKPGAGSSFDPPDRSVTMDSTAEWISHGQVIAPASADAWSLGGWFYCPTSVSGDRLLAISDASTARGIDTRNNGGYFYTQIASGAAGAGTTRRSTQAIPTGSWFHFMTTKGAGAHDYTKIKIYLNGSEVTGYDAEANGAGDLPSSPTFAMGARAYGPGGFWGTGNAGYTYYDAELSSAQVSAIAAAYTTNLKSLDSADNLKLWVYYRAAETNLVDANGVLDYSGSDFHGSAQNMAAGNLSETVPG